MLTMMRPIVCVLIAVATGASGSESQRVRFGPGVCGPVDPVYVKGATETGGQPFPMSPTEVGKSSRIMESSFLPEMMLWASGHSEDSYSIPVDRTVARMMFSGTFDATGGSLTLIAPDGTVIQQGDRIDDTPLNCGRIITVDAPASGTWQVRMAPTGRFWLTVHAKSDVSLTDAAFVEHEARPESDRVVRIQGEPITGRPATLRVSISPTFKSPDVSARVAGRTGTSVNRPAVRRRPRIRRYCHASHRAISRCSSTVAMNPAPELSASGLDCSTASSSRSFRRPLRRRSREPSCP